MTQQTINTPHNTVQVAAVTPEKKEVAPIDLGHDRLLACLYFIFDAFDRCGIEFFLVRDTAKKAMTEYMLEGDHLDIGVRSNEWQNDQKDILLPFFEQERVEKVKELPTEITFKWQDIPFTIHLYPNNEMTLSLVPIVYEHEHWKIPNQFTRFEKEIDK